MRARTHTHTHIHSHTQQLAKYIDLMSNVKLCFHVALTLSPSRKICQLLLNLNYVMLIILMINAYNHNSFLLGDLPDNNTNVKQEMIANTRTQLRKDAMLIRGILDPFFGGN